MKPADTLRSHFRLLRNAFDEYAIEYHANFMTGYLYALRETKQADSELTARLQEIVLKAWHIRHKQLRKQARRAA